MKSSTLRLFAAVGSILDINPQTNYGTLAGGAASDLESLRGDAQQISKDFNKVIEDYNAKSIAHGSGAGRGIASRSSI